MKQLKKLILLNLISITIATYPVQASDNFSLFLKAKEAEKLGKFSTAIKWFRKALNKNINPELKMKILFHMGDCYYALNNQIAAFSLYEEALRDPKAKEYLLLHPKTYLNLANIYFNRGQYSKAAEIYLTLTEKYKNKAFIPFALVKAGDSLLHLRKYKEALKVYSKVILLYKDSDEYWIARFRMADIGLSNPGFKVPDYIEYRDYITPLNAYKSISKNAPKDMFKLKLLAYLRIASVCMKNKRYLDSIRIIKSVTRYKLEPSLNEYAKRLMAKCACRFVNMLYKKKDYLGICRVYQLIHSEIALSKLDNTVIERIADALCKMDMYKEALDLYLLNPKKYLKKIAFIYNQLGRYNETINLLKPLKSRLDPEAAFILAKAFYKKRRYKDVVDTLSLYIEKISDPEACYLLASSYDQLNNKEKAIYYYKILSKKDSEYRLNACLSAGNILFDLKRYQEALNFYITAQKLCKDCIDADFIKLQIANCYYQMGNYKRSAQILKKMQGKGLIRWVSNMQLEIIQLENTYEELKWLIE